MCGGTSRAATIRNFTEFASRRGTTRNTKKNSAATCAARRAKPRRAAAKARSNRQPCKRHNLCTHSQHYGTQPADAAKHQPCLTFPREEHTHPRKQCNETPLDTSIAPKTALTLYNTRPNDLHHGQEATCNATHRANCNAGHWTTTRPGLRTAPLLAN